MTKSVYKYKVLGGSSGGLRIAILSIKRKSYVFVESERKGGVLISKKDDSLSSINACQVRPFLLSRKIEGLRCIFIARNSTSRVGKVRRLLRGRGRKIRVSTLILPPRRCVSRGLLRLTRVTGRGKAEILAVCSKRRIKACLGYVTPLTAEGGRHAHNEVRTMPHLRTKGRTSIMLRLGSKTFRVLLAKSLRKEKRRRLIRDKALRDYPVLGTKRRKSGGSKDRSFLRVIGPELALVSTKVRGHCKRPRTRALRHLERVKDRMLSARRYNTVALGDSKQGVGIRGCLWGCKGEGEQVKANSGGTLIGILIVRLW